MTTSLSLAVAFLSLVLFVVGAIVSAALFDIARAIETMFDEVEADDV